MCFVGGESYPKVQTHALAPGSDPTRLRIWLGVFDEHPPERLEWSLDGQPLAADEVVDVRPLRHAEPGPRHVQTQSAVVDLRLPADEAGTRPIRTVDVVAVWGGRRAAARPLRVRPLPARIPVGLGESFRVMLVSCFYRGTDKSGRAGVAAHAISTGPGRPDLVLTVGDQVYLDIPPPGPLHVTASGFAREFEEKYRANWQSDREGVGYAEILRAAPVAAIPDDHEYWNNYPAQGIGGAPWPSRWFERTRRLWASAAKEMYDVFQLADRPDAPDAYCYEIDVAPLSIFMMDNRTFRTEVETDEGETMRSLRRADLQRFEAWVERMIATPQAVPLLVTGPSLLQPPSTKRWADLNAADVLEYPDVMGGLQRMLRAGCAPLALTGDVHYPRVTRARPARPPTGGGGPLATHPWPDLHEVISSPASLVAFQSPKKSKPARPDFDIDAGRGGRLACTKLWPRDPDRVVGDQVAVLEFTRRSTGVELTVRYYPVENGGTRSLALPPIRLRRRPQPQATQPQSTQPQSTQHRENP